MHRAGAVFLLLLPACNVVFGLELLPDAGPDLAIDATDAAPEQLDAPGPAVFGPPTKLTIAGAIDPHQPTVTADVQQLFLVMTDAQFHNDIFLTTRVTPDDPGVWDTPIKLSSTVNTTANSEQSPRVSADGLDLYFSQLIGTPSHQIRVAQRPSPGEPFGASVLVSDLSTTNADDRPGTPSATTPRHMVISRGTNATRVVLIEFVQDAPDVWSEVAVDTLAVVNGGMLFDLGIIAPHLSSDGLTLVFAAGSATRNYDVYITQRGSLDTPFEQPAKIISIMSDADETNPTISGDGRLLFFGRQDAAQKRTVWYSRLVE